MVLRLARYVNAIQLTDDIRLVAFAAFRIRTVLRSTRSLIDFNHSGISPFAALSSSILQTPYSSFHSFFHCSDPPGAITNCGNIGVSHIKYHKYAWVENEWKM